MFNKKTCGSVCHIWRTFFPVSYIIICIVRLTNILTVPPDLMRKAWIWSAKGRSEMLCREIGRGRTHYLIRVTFQFN